MPVASPHHSQLSTHQTPLRLSFSQGRAGFPAELQVGSVTAVLHSSLLVEYQKRQRLRLSISTTKLHTRTVSWEDELLTEAVKTSWGTLSWRPLACKDSPWAHMEKRKSASTTPALNVGNPTSYLCFENRSKLLLHNTEFFNVFSWQKENSWESKNPWKKFREIQVIDQTAKKYSRKAGEKNKKDVQGRQSQANLPSCD